MTKKFEMTKDKLIVTINTNADIFLPNEKHEKVKVGTYTQQTIQNIDKDKAIVLQDYVNNEMKKATEQLNALKKQYEPIKDIIDLDEKIVEATRKALQKGTKAFKDKAIHLSNHIGKMDNKKNLKTQIDYINKQIDEIKLDVDGLNKVIN